MLGDQIEANSISLALVVSTCQLWKFGVPPKWGTMSSHMDMVPCPTSNLGHKVAIGMHIDMAHVDIGCGGVHVGALGISWTLFLGG
jgi:hypothetical protein